MTKQYKIEGMTCGGCVNTVTKALETVPGVQQADVRLEAPQGTLQLDRPVPVETLQKAIGHYRIEELKPAQASASFLEVEAEELAPTGAPSPTATTTVLPEKNLTTYKPLLLIVLFIAGVSLLAQYPFAEFSGMLWMRHFMAGFFIVFAFFKLLNLEGFANSYAMYDIIAARWHGWGYVYPFVELALGILYLINVAPFATNLATIIVLGVSSIGVIQSNLSKRKIKCACLGDVFNLPMSTVTIVEDLSMVGMAALMLLL